MEVLITLFKTVVVDHLALVHMLLVAEYALLLLALILHVSRVQVI